MLRTAISILTGDKMPIAHRKNTHLINIIKLWKEELNGYRHYRKARTIY